MDVGLIYIAAFLALALFLYNARTECAVFARMALRHWPHTAFLLLCMSLGTTIGLLQGSMAQALPAASERHEAVEQARTDDIRSCKDFVSAKLERRPGYVAPSPSLLELARMGAHSYWERCAYIFGMNYWRADISIGGRNGGELLCQAYRVDHYRSPIVEGWCDRVFMPPTSL